MDRKLGHGQRIAATEGTQASLRTEIMPYRLLYTPRAASDLEDIRLYYSRGGRAALKRASAISKALRMLADGPYRWPIDDRNAAYRMRIVEGHRIRYRIIEETGVVLIIRVRGPWQDLP
ncbi:type II toxin-antitoxin system RelE/ParE family toxin [Aerophototrophica crusticola]|uniref:Type II toxin-antitoxin system RelE/ParE family toxin n=1 Tax=Aerophototrophica crusticola TaxID=1709002 RepID=A0A858R8M6_9PROT|nr:type II toxin-antitoxin system RelE/ParE family toxin [Rhodospirillaceae bacterium B3]